MENSIKHFLVTLEKIGIRFIPRRGKLVSYGDASKLQEEQINFIQKNKEAIILEVFKDTSDIYLQPVPV
ncbi:MAG: hypothetical protein ACRC0V_03295 [Fusobacteriaceae bacterium]